MCHLVHVVVVWLNTRIRWSYNNRRGLLFIFNQVKDLPESYKALLINYCHAVRQDHGHHLSILNSREGDNPFEGRRNKLTQTPDPQTSSYSRLCEEGLICIIRRGEMAYHITCPSVSILDPEFCYNVTCVHCAKQFSLCRLLSHFAMLN